MVDKEAAVLQVEFIDVLLWVLSVAVLVIIARKILRKVASVDSENITLKEE